MSDVTQILSRMECGDYTRSDKLLPLVYEELRKLAAARLRQETPGQTLQATALLHAAYVRLVDSSSVQTWNSRGHFFAAAAEAMRRILVERARQKASRKAGGHWNRVDMPDVEQDEKTSVLDLIALDEALKKLESRAPRKAELVKLRFFAGLNILDAARALGISVSTAENDWVYAKCWLRLELSGEQVLTGECQPLRPATSRSSVDISDF